MAAAVAVQKAQAVPTSEPTSEPMEVAGEQQDEDLYTRLKTLQRQLEFLEIQVGWPAAAESAATNQAGRSPTPGGLSRRRGRQGRPAGIGEGDR